MQQNTRLQRALEYPYTRPGPSGHSFVFCNGKYTHTHVQKHARTHASKQAHTHTQSYTHTRARIHTHIHAHTHTHARTRTHIDTHTHTCFRWVPPFQQWSVAWCPEPANVASSAPECQAQGLGGCRRITQVNLMHICYLRAIGDVCLCVIAGIVLIILGFEVYDHLLCTYAHKCACSFPLVIPQM